MNNDEQKRFKATNPKVSDVQAFKQILGKLFKTPISERWGKQICLNE